MAAGSAWKVGVVVAIAVTLGATWLASVGTARGAVRCTIVGTSHADTLVGTSRKDVICGRGGKDVLRGRGGGDVLYGGGGADTLDGGGGADRLLGGTGNDRLRGAGGGDRLEGQGGADNLVGGRGPDRLLGGGGADTLDGRDSPVALDYLFCGADPDVALADDADSVAPDCETVSGVNHAPTDIVLSNADVAENLPAGTVVGTLSAADPDVGDTHTFSLVAGAGGDDNAKFQISGAELQTSQPLDFEADASLSIRVETNDGHGGTFPEAFSITVTDATEPPALAGIEAASLIYSENDSATVVSSTLTVADVDSFLTGATVTIASNLAPGDELTFASLPGIAITGSYSSGVLTLTGAASPANYQTALREVKYVSTSENPGSATRVITFQAKDGPGPGNLSNTVSRNVTVNPVNDAPVADDETFNGASGAIGNTALVVNDPDDGAPTLTSPKKVISGDILAGDTDVDSGSLIATAQTVSTNDGGSVTTEADGDFIYRPAASTSCVDTSDSFDYTVSDQQGGEDTGRVTIGLAGCVWYVSNNAPGNSGTSSAPFDTLTQAEAASSSNQTVFVFDGDNTSTGYGGDGYALNSGERLIGEHEGLVVDPDGGGSLGSQTLYTANPGAHPTLTAANSDVIDLDDGNDVRGLNIDPQGTGGGIAGSTGDTGGSTIDDVNISDSGTVATQPGLELDGTTGTFNISNLVVDNVATGVRLNNAGTVVFSPAGEISITSFGAAGLFASSTNMGTSAFDQVSVTSSISGGVTMSNTTGTTTFGDGTGLDLALHTAAGATPAFGISNGGTIAVPAGATGGISTVNATGGPAVSVTATTIGPAGLTFQSVASNGATSGIVLDNTGATAGLTVTGLPPFAGSGGTIQNSTGPGISLSSTKSPAFSFMNVQNGGDDGIRGSAVNGFSVTSSTVAGNGDDFEEHGLDFGSGLTGAASISNSTVSGSAENNVLVTNSTGALALTVTGSTFSNTSAVTGNDGVRVDSYGGTATTVSIENSSFANNRGNHFSFLTDFSSSGANDVTFSDNTLTRSVDSLGAGIIVSTDGSSDTTFTLADNNIQGAVWSAIWVELGQSSTAGGTSTGTISGNTIGNPAVANSGSSTLSAVNTIASGSGTMTVSINDNLLREYNLAGIDIVSRNGSPAVNATVTGNTVSDPGTNAVNGLLLRSGATTGDGGTVCAGISGNTLAGSSANGSTDFRLRQRFNTTVRLPGYNGSAGDTDAVVAFTQGNNPGAETGSATADFPTTGDGFAGGAACPTP